jgi:hypothetical protein
MQRMLSDTSAEFLRGTRQDSKKAVEETTTRER